MLAGMRLRLALVFFYVTESSATISGDRVAKILNTHPTSEGHEDGEVVYQEHEVPEEVFSYDISRPVKIVLWSKVSQTYKHVKSLSNCELDLTYALHDGQRHSNTLDPDIDISGADVVIFNLAMLSHEYVLPRRKPEGQLWIAYCSEPVNFADVGLDGGDCHLLTDPATMSVMDAVSSYDGDSDFPSFFTPPTETQMRRDPPQQQQPTGAEQAPLATFASSDCRSTQRTDHIVQLNASLESLGMHGAILSYGDCLNTVEETQCGGAELVQKEEWSDMIVSIVNRCMARQFALVVENTDSPWYITEKLWFAFASGSVPVYFGADAVKGLVPPGSIVFAKDYDTPDALAAALISFNEEKLAEAQAFKSRPVSEWGAWAMARKFSHMTLLPRICEVASKRPPVQRDAPTTETPTGPSPSTSALSVVSAVPALRGVNMFMAEPRTQSQPCRALRLCGKPSA